MSLYRNDFVHAVFATASGSSWMLMQLSPGSRVRPKRNEAIALRTRDTEKKRSISDLAKVRNDAAIVAGDQVLKLAFSSVIACPKTFVGM
jgi:hypothetical protein